ncbi:MFS transporter [Sphingobium sp.]|uniref:MFS transporter n=1 Tax=Sphingobium sp. TaxID=1912891 RepID=UPI002D1BF392|nr:MFS transporter [Sphingobium sp.]HUD93531.1 MFS transporter [Sphingobium sp.]
MTQSVGSDYVMDARRDRLVIAASALGTVFEWYDFYIYGVLAPIIGRTFFPTDNPTVELLYTLAGFAIGFAFRPIGAMLFGYLGDRLGRKYTFLATIILMGAATAGVGLTPSAASIGIAAPIILILLRIAQGLALGGEYGGAAIYVAEHAPTGKRGFYTSFIQAGVIGGFILSLIVVVGTQWIVGKAVWDDWGWRIPFILSLLLLGISLWMRLMLHESPVFTAMKAAGAQAKNPLKESFTAPGNKRRMFVAMIGIAAGFTVIAYTVMFQALYFLQNGLHVAPGMAQLLVGGSAFAGVASFIFFGWLSDRVGRKKPIVIGYALVLLLALPLYQYMGATANPALQQAASRAPVVVGGPDCRFDPFAKVQPTICGKLLDHFSKRGIPYDSRVSATSGVTIGDRPVDDLSPAGLDAALKAGGYDFGAVTPDWPRAMKLFAALLLLWTLSGATYGPVAALLSEYFPARIRYSSLSIPYHIGTGYFGGFLPLVSQYIVARTGDPYAGLWYTLAVVALALVTCLIALPETKDRPLDA